MPLRKDSTLYTATLRNLKLNAFGFDQVLRETFSITIYQVTCKPPRWAARPQLSHGGHTWSGGSETEVMRLVESDFEELVTPWAAAPQPMPISPSLRSATDIAAPRRKA